MPDNENHAAPAQGQFLVYQAEDGMLKIDVRLEEESVRLPQQHLADLLQTSVTNVSMHIKSISEDVEL